MKRQTNAAMRQTRDAKKRPSPLERTAHHEAGHAVASFELGCSVKRLSIIPDQEKNQLGVCLGPDSPPWFRPDSSNDSRIRAFVERRILILFAGAIAEAKFTGRHSWRRAARDMETVADLAPRVCGSDEEANKYVAWLKVRAEGFFRQPDPWHAVEMLAAALLEHRELSGRRARAIYCAAFRDGMDDVPGGGAAGAR